MESSWYVPVPSLPLHTHQQSRLTCSSATASYRLHPLIVLNPKNPVPRHLAQKFAKCFSPGVVKVSPDGEVSLSAERDTPLYNWGGMPTPDSL